MSEEACKKSHGKLVR